MTSAIISPISVSRALIAAMCAMSSLVRTGLLSRLISSTTAATPRSMPRLSAIGFAPAVTLRRPSVMIAWASTMLVVVPSPAMSLVLAATSSSSWAPMFS